jgi:hypothetical protein
MLHKRYAGRSTDDEGEVVDDDYIKKKVIRIKEELLRYLSLDGFKSEAKAGGKISSRC